MKRIIFPFLVQFFGLIIVVNGQDTLKVMQYNLLNYGVYNIDCTLDNNNLATKNDALRKITGYVLPDILGVNEVSRDEKIFHQILDSVLNVNGVNHFRRSEYSNGSNSDLVNFVFYNNDKLTLKSQERIITAYRDIIFYHFYYNNPDLSVNHDTAHLTVIVAHLKAGNTTFDTDERTAEAKSIMDLLNGQNKPGNYLLMGDFNLYDASEEAFQLFTKHSNFDLRFYDPVNKIGKWNENEDYALYHTQSTRSTANNCMASSGLDDRFDFILTSYWVLSGANDFAFIPGSYKAVGQDGNHFNSSVKAGTNNSAPDSVIQALYDLSDHLPVTLQLKVNKTHSSILESSDSGLKIKSIFGDQNGINVLFSSCQPGNCHYSVYDISGKLLSKNHFNYEIGSQQYDHKIDLRQGIYLIKFETNSGIFATKKVVVI